MIKGLFHGGTNKSESLFLESLELNNKNMRRTSSVRSSVYDLGVGKKRGTSIIYASQLNPKSYMHFSWLGEGCALRDYSLSSSREPKPDRSYATSKVRALIEHELPLSRKEAVTKTSAMHQRVVELNKRLILE